ncbi:MAG: hypothetical protein H7Y60_18265 [Rhodospirillaceae bacterium]|nr:hypothetical protein [Rhodospirillales bacterium]
MDDDEVALLGLFKPELDWIGDHSIMLAQLRAEIEDFFVSHQVAQTQPRLKELTALACRRHQYASMDEIAAHADVIRDGWRDTPHLYWGEPFMEDSFAQMRLLTR